jgi:2-polyprenyl-3-methyl-5-hydroxy-6-metoxy-1,4-benzoquinol methylase
MLNPTERDGMDRSKKFWDRIADQWEREGENLDETSIEIIENTIELLNSTDTVLDYGCGIGTITKEIAPHVKEVQAIDISPKMIEIAAKIAAERRIENIRYAEATIFDASMKPETFNVIMAFNILHLVEDTQKVIQRINELLEPGGLFVSTTACMGEKRSVWGFLLSLLSKTRLIPVVTMFTNAELEGIIENSGFKIMAAKTMAPSAKICFIAAEKR